MVAPARHRVSPGGHGAQDENNLDRIYRMHRMPFILCVPFILSAKSSRLTIGPVFSLELQSARPEVDQEADLYAGGYEVVDELSFV